MRGYPPTLGGLLLGLALTITANAFDFYVSPQGKDSWSGRLQTPNTDKTDGPFATLERARDGIRTLKQNNALPASGVQVILRGGIYSLATPFTLASQDSGTDQAPIVYRGFAGETVRLVGGQVLTGFKTVTDPSILERLDVSARGKLLQVDLRAQGITHYGQASGGGLELFFMEKPMPLSRWPNEGFTRIPNVLGKTPVDVRGTKGTVEGLFTFSDDRPKRWKQEKDVWVHGYWFWDWADQRQHVKTIDTEQRVIEIEPPYHSYGYRSGQWYYAYNLLSEIDLPGEWYLDRSTGILYFWPPSPIQQGQAMVSILPTVLSMNDVSHVTFSGIVIEAVRETAITLTGGHSNRIVGCTIRNVGGSAINISGGSSHGVMSCDIYQCGSGGVSLSGGDRKALSPAGHYADNNHIHHYGRWKPMYSAGISLNGVGNRATHNLIDNAPHQAISFSGNEHLMEFNEIHSVCFESNDAGAIYAGRDWTMRGTVIRHNYLHDISGLEGRGCVGVYLDDMFCGTEISGNIFHRVTSAAFIGGGRDCSIENNVFVDCKPALHVDARALGWAKYHADEWVKEGQTSSTLSGISYKTPPYSERYPALPRILDDNPHAPKGNRVVRNICVGGRWDDIEGEARPLISFQDNLLNEDPHFVNAERFNFQLKQDSPALKLGFKPIPADQIGLYRDAYWTNWPVPNAVRPTQ